MGWFLALIEGVRFYFCHIERGWWKKWPYLPLIPKRYLKFRADTAYGMVENDWKRPPWRLLILDAKGFLLWRREHRLEARRRRRYFRERSRSAYET